MKWHKKKGEWQRKKRWEEETESNLGTWPLYAELVESDTSPCGWHMEPIVATVQEGQGEGISGGVAGSDSLHTEKARLLELKDDTDVSRWPSRPSVTGNWPSHTGPVMWRKWWETCVDQSLWAGSCPFNMADSQQQLTMQWCRQRTDRCISRARYIHDIRSKKCQILGLVYLFLIRYFSIWIGFIRLNYWYNADTFCSLVYIVGYFLFPFCHCTLKASGYTQMFLLEFFSHRHTVTSIRTVWICVC